MAQLARIELANDEKKALLQDMESILKFVEQIQEVDVSLDAKERVGTPHNVLREDTKPHESGWYTQKLLDEAPDTQDGYVKVKKIL